MPNFRLQLTMVAVTMLLFTIMLSLNAWLFSRLEFAPGINWIYLPAGMRLLCTLLFAEAGAIGLLLVSWPLCFFFFFPDDYLRSFVGGLIAAAAPYLVYRAARAAFGMDASLASLSSGRLLIVIGVYAVVSPLLHHIWYALQGSHGDLLNGFAVMVAGDMAGTLIVVYSLKALLGRFAMLPRERA